MGEWCCEVVGSCEVQLSCEVRCSTSSEPNKNLYVCVHVCVCVFSFSCGENWHDPVQCKWLKKWIKKCDDDSETSNWIAANTRVRSNHSGFFIYFIVTIKYLSKYYILPHKRRFTYKSIPFFLRLKNRPQFKTHL